MLRDARYWCYSCLATIDGAGPTTNTTASARAFPPEHERIERLRKAASDYRKAKALPRQRRWNGREWEALMKAGKVPTTERERLEQATDTAMGTGELPARTPIKLEDFLKVRNRKA